MYTYVINPALGRQWFHDRKLIGPAFHFGILEDFATIQSEKAEILTKRLEEQIEKRQGEAIDFFPLALGVALDIICGNAHHIISSITILYDSFINESLVSI